MTVEAALGDYLERNGPRVLEVLRSAAGRSENLDARLADAGMSASDADLARLDRLPVLSKDALPALQHESPPLGGLLAEGASVVRLFASPGPIYEPQLAGPDPWNWAPALEACGIGPDDVVLNCFSYHLSPAGAMFDEACRAVGATVVPGGVGAPELQAQVIGDLGVTAYIGLPSYLATLVDRFGALTAQGGGWKVAKALVTAEPLPDALRDQLRERVATVLMAYGTAEAGLIGYETAPGAGLRLPDESYIQVCDPATGGPVEPGALGEVVVSLLHADYPLLRFGTGDVSRWVLGPDGDLRLAGVLGRVGAAVKVRGMFVHPHQAGQVIGALRELGATGGRFVVERTGDKDVLRLELVAADGADRDALRTSAEQQTRDTLRVRPEVSLVDAVEGEAVLVDTRSWD
ncbi:MAG TPA: AMP-binding protein [Nocardioidaceae bacterium]|nr:AMP-binding protein [Nocardioidaceae bacterium]